MICNCQPPAVVVNKVQMWRISTFFLQQVHLEKESVNKRVDTHKREQSHFLETPLGFGQRSSSTDLSSWNKKERYEIQISRSWFPPGAEDKWGWLMKQRRFVTQSGLFCRSPVQPYWRTADRHPHGPLSEMFFISTSSNRGGGGGAVGSRTTFDNEFSLGNSPATVRRKK